MNYGARGWATAREVRFGDRDGNENQERQGNLGTHMQLRIVEESLEEHDWWEVAEKMWDQGLRQSCGGRSSCAV